MKKLTILLFCFSLLGFTIAQNDWVKCGTGTEFSVALKSDGTLWSWGSNLNGQLGIGNTTNQNHPIQIGNQSDWNTFAIGSFHALAIKMMEQCGDGD